MTAPGDATGPEVYEWTAHPARRRPQDLMLFVAIMMFSTYAVMVSLESAFLAALAAAILVVAVMPFLAPTRYRLDGEGVSERRLGRRRFRAWTDLRRLQIGPGAALVTPFARKSWMDRYRGILLYLDGADRDRVVAVLRARVVKPLAAPPSPP